MVPRRYRLSEEVELLPGGAAFLKDEETLLVADLHLGCEASLEYEGFSVPRLQTERVRNSLFEMMEITHPKRLVVVGDLKHNFDRNLDQEWADVTAFVESITGKVDIEVVRGNHDNYLGMILSKSGVQLNSEASVGDFRILHGHKGSVEGGPAIMGHLHPSLGLREGVGPRLKQPCFLYHPDEHILILPAMSILAGGVDVLRENADKMLSAVSTIGLGRFIPIVFAGDRALRFPDVRTMRADSAGIK